MTTIKQAADVTAMTALNAFLKHNRERFAGNEAALAQIEATQTLAESKSVEFWEPLVAEHHSKSYPSDAMAYAQAIAAELQ